MCKLSKIHGCQAKQLQQLILGSQSSNWNIHDKGTLYGTVRATQKIWSDFGKLTVDMLMHN